MGDQGYTREDLEEYYMILKKTFKNEAEGYKYYKGYAKDKCFGVRKGQVNCDRITKHKIRRRFICSRQGYRMEEHMNRIDRKRDLRALTRCGCEAELAISLNKITGDWFVKKFVEVHNHPPARPGEAGVLWSHRALSNVQQAEAVELKAGGLRTHQVMEVMARKHGGYENLGFLSKDLYNFFDRHRRGQVCAGDADHVIRYMKSRKKDDMEYFFAYENNNEGHLKRLFWADPQSRIDYYVFGDGVVFDSTYRVNRYNLPFIPVVGVNHHGSTVIFGCGVISDETVESYEWLLKTFLRSTCQRHPTSLITDGDNAMQRAIESVMPKADHRLCIWHIDQNMMRHLRPNMLEDFRALVYSSIETDVFETKWIKFKEKFDVAEDNNWISRMYTLRRKWAAAYLKGRVFLGMKSNQRSESLNSKLHTHLDRKMSLTDMLGHYEQSSSTMRQREAELDGHALQSVPFTTEHASLLEKHAAEIFTPNAFKKVKAQIDKSVKWKIREVANNKTSVDYVLVLAENNDKVVSVSSVLDGPSVSEIVCPCSETGM